MGTSDADRILALLGRIEDLSRENAALRKVAEAAERLNDKPTQGSPVMMSVTVPFYAFDSVNSALAELEKVRQG